MTISVKITVESTGKVFDTLSDWGLAVGNNNYIGDPVQEKNYLEIPGASATLDLSEVLTGRPVFKYRPIRILLGGKKSRLEWDSIISEYRNEIEGQVVRLTFSNDMNFFWRGRVSITDFDRTRELGQFTLSIPMADPYKYDIFSSEDDWLWDPFDFEYGVIRYIGPVEFDNNSITVPKGNMLTVPIFEIDTIIGSLSVIVNGNTYNLVVGENRFPQLLVAGTEEIVLQFSGKGTGSIKYRGGSL